MIIEMFGPAGCGKTTLSRVLARTLRADGQSVTLVASDRPAEQETGTARAPLAATMARTAKVADIVSLAMRSREPDVGEALLGLLPPTNPLWALRYRRYLAGLQKAWSHARLNPDITIFDQGYLCALCSLILLGPAPKREVVVKALELLPSPDLLVRLDPPKGVLEARVMERLRAQSWMERLFEMNSRTSLRQVETTASVIDLLAERGRTAICVQSVDAVDLERAVSRLLDEIREPALETAS